MQEYDDDDDDAKHDSEEGSGEEEIYSKDTEISRVVFENRSWT